MNWLFAILAPPLTIALGLAASLWLFNAWGAGVLGTVAGLGLLLVRPRPSHRAALWPLPIAALLLSLSCAAWFWHLRGQYLAYLASLGRWLPDAALKTLPQDVSGALAMGNALFLTLWLWIVLAFLLARQRFPCKGVPLGIAYEQALGGGRQWVLKPGWLPIRWLSYCAAGLGGIHWLVIHLALWNLLDALPWMGLLPVGLYAVGLALAHWLGGPLNEKWQPEFAGEAAQTLSSADFEALWRRYRNHWPSLWRAAGNLAPERKD